MKRILIVGIIFCSIFMVACGQRSTKSSDTTQVSTQASGYAFDTKGISINMNQKIEDIKSKLGEPSDYYEAKSCAFDGMDKFYYYDGFTIQGYQKDNEDRVSSVTFMDDTIKTNEGIRLGDSKDKVKQVYGENLTESDGQLQYELGNTKLQFIIQNDVVKGIEYLLKF